MEYFSKDFFQATWGEDGYFEEFSWGVGIDKVCEICVNPFSSLDKTAIEIGSGGGAFTKRIVGKFKHLTCIDVIRKPNSFEWDNLTYIELENKSFDCPVESNSIDYAFTYGLFCHLSNDQLIKYLHGINKALKKGADFVFMLSNYGLGKDESELGKLLDMGHFVQDLRTLDIIVDLKEWEIVNSNMIPQHRDLLVHLKKK